MTKFMNTKERCSQCGDKLKENAAPVKTKDGYKVCSNWCRDNWDQDLK